MSLVQIIGLAILAIVGCDVLLSTFAKKGN